MRACTLFSVAILAACSSSSSGGTTGVRRGRAHATALQVVERRADGCSAPRPLLGTPCTQEGLQCDWFDCCNDPALGPREQCKDGVWQGYVNTACACALPTCG